MQYGGAPNECSYHFVQGMICRTDVEGGCIECLMESIDQKVDAIIWRMKWMDLM